MFCLLSPLCPSLLPWPWVSVTHPCTPWPSLTREALPRVSIITVMLLIRAETLPNSRRLSRSCLAGGRGLIPARRRVPSQCGTPLTHPCAPPGRPPGSPAVGEGRRRARETSPGTEGTRISQDLVGGSLAIDTLPANETRIVVSPGPPPLLPAARCLPRGRIRPAPDRRELFPGWAGSWWSCWL